MTTPMIPANLERYLTMTSQSEQVVSTNMANVDTPGYHAKALNFEQTLWRASQLDDGSATTPVIRDEEGLMERADGNNVDLDRESLSLAKAQMQYGLGVQLVKSEFQEVLSAIKGGD